MEQKLETVSTTAIASLFKVGKTTFQQCVHLIEDFPKPYRLVGNRRIFLLSEVMAWAEKQTDPKQSIKLADRKYQSYTRRGTTNEADVINRLRFQFLRGDFDRPELKQMREQLLAASRLNTGRVRIIQRVAEDFA